MPILYVEILTDSRAFDLSRTSISQKLTIEFQLPTDDIDPDELQEPVFDSTKAEFLGHTDDVLALETAYSLVPLTRWLPGYEGNELLLVLDTLSVVQRDNYDWWKAEASYKYDYNAGTGSAAGESEVGDLTLPYIKIGFKTGNETTRITESLEIVDTTISSDADMLRDAPNTGYAIGATADGIEGTEVYSGGLQLQITAYYFPEQITLAFINTLANLFFPLGRAVTNNNIFLGYQAGEVLLKGWDGSTAVTDVIPITFDFDVKKNMVNFSDPGFEDNITCEGHDLLDYRYVKKFDEDAQTEIQFPCFRFIHRVYEKADFSILGFPID